MSNRDRRARQRESTERVVLVGDHSIARPTGNSFPVSAAAGRLPPKVPGRHRFIVTCAYAVTDDHVRQAHAPEQRPTFLDHESLIHMAIGCWDCERPYPDATPDNECPAPGDDP